MTLPYKWCICCIAGNGNKDALFTVLPREYGCKSGNLGIARWISQISIVDLKTKKRKKNLKLPWSAPLSPPADCGGGEAEVDFDWSRRSQLRRRRLRQNNLEATSATRCRGVFGGDNFGATSATEEEHQEGEPTKRTRGRRAPVEVGGRRRRTTASEDGELMWHRSRELPIGIPW